MKKLRDEGFDIVLRSAGSHSAIDVIGIRRKDMRIKCIQSKPASMSEKDKQKLLDENLWLTSSHFLVTFEVQ